MTGLGGNAFFREKEALGNGTRRCCWMNIYVPALPPGGLPMPGLRGLGVLSLGISGWLQLWVGSRRPSWRSRPCFWTAECISLLEQIRDVHVFMYLWENFSSIKSFNKSPETPGCPKPRC